MSSYHCPYCRADLKELPLFFVNDDMYVCDECGKRVYDYTMDIKRCKSCGAILNGQDGYENWLPNFICTECYTFNEGKEGHSASEPSSDPISTAIGAATTTADAVSSVAKLVGNIAEAKLEKQRAEESRRKSESEASFTGCLFPLLAFVALILALVLFVNHSGLVLKLIDLVAEIETAVLKLVVGALEGFFSGLS